jgi:hypothetical protein
VELFRKWLIYLNFLECIDAQILENLVETLRQVQFLFEDHDHHVDAHSNPDLRLDSVGRRAEKALDPEILFDPLEEQFHLPAAFVEQGNGQRRQRKVVRQVNEKALRLGIEIADAPQAGC